MKLLLAIYRIGTILFFCSPLIALLFIRENGENMTPGNGMISSRGRCSNCNAVGRLKCMTCYGSGIVNGSECGACNRLGHVADPMCGGRGFNE